MSSEEMTFVFGCLVMICSTIMIVAAIFSPVPKRESPPRKAYTPKMQNRPTWVSIRGPVDDEYWKEINKWWDKDVCGCKEDEKDK